MASWFPALVYTLCFLTSSACALLLARNYRRTGARLLLWSALCFVFRAFVLRAPSHLNGWPETTCQCRCFES